MTGALSVLRALKGMITTGEGVIDICALLPSMPRRHSCYLAVTAATCLQSSTILDGMAADADSTSGAGGAAAAAAAAGGGASPPPKFDWLTLVPGLRPLLDGLSSIQALVGGLVGDGAVFVATTVALAACRELAWPRPAGSGAAAGHVEL